MNFNEKLIELRKRNNLSQEQLGNMVGVSRQTISKWELGDTTPELGKLMELSKVFNVSMDELVGKEINSTSKKATYGYEYKSKKTIFGLPLIHINVGIGLKKAKGIIAIGNVSQGIISIGGVAMGLISLGGLSLGLLAFGGLVLALLAFGGISLGVISFGGLAIGIYSFGGLAIGMYSFGGCAIASKIGIGGYAKGHITIADNNGGDISFHIGTLLDKDIIEKVILNEYPKIPKIVLKIIKSLI